MALCLWKTLQYEKRSCKVWKEIKKFKRPKIYKIINKLNWARCPPIAQLVEQLPFKQMVPGSNPGGRTASFIKSSGPVDPLAADF